MTHSRIIVGVFADDLSQWLLRIGDVDFAGYWRDDLHRKAARHPDVRSFVVVLLDGTPVMGFVRG